MHVDVLDVVVILIFAWTIFNIVVSTYMNFVLWKTKKALNQLKREYSELIKADSVHSNIDRPISH